MTMWGDTDRRIQKLKLVSLRGIGIGHFDYTDPEDEDFFDDIVAPVGAAHRLKEWGGSLRNGCNKYQESDYIVPRTLVSKSWAPDCTRVGCFPVTDG